MRRMRRCPEFPPHARYTLSPADGLSPVRAVCQRANSVRKNQANLLDIGNLRGKALRDLRDDLLYELLVLHGLPRLHDTGVA